MPATPPITRIVPIVSPPHRAAMPSATARSGAARSAAGSDEPTVSTMITYQPTAATRETRTMVPILRNGRSISSADWGMTSRPTNRNDVATSTPTATQDRCTS